MFWSYGVVVSISGCDPLDPGSTPGTAKFLILIFKFCLFLKNISKRDLITEVNYKYNKLIRFETFYLWYFCKFRGSIVVSIPACHAGNPGSIPGLGAFFGL